MGLLKQYLFEALEKMERDKIRLKFFGDLRRLSPALLELIDRTDKTSAKYQGFQANICLNYGGRDEIVHAARAFAQACTAGEAKPEDLTESVFSDYLYSAGIPDPDLIIRPSGEIRISNFLLWQSAYAEYYFTDVLWPDFTPAELDKAIAAFHRRNRRFWRRVSCENQNNCRGSGTPAAAGGAAGAAAGGHGDPGGRHVGHCCV